MWELISNVPSVSKPVAVVQAILNLVLPGVGTWVTACAASENVSKTQLTIGFLQLLTSFVLIGWVWAIYWSFLAVKKSFRDDTLMAQGASQQYTGVSGQQFNPTSAGFGGPGQFSQN